MNALSLAEQEHLDHVAGEATEFQNCFTEAGDKLRQLRSQAAVNIARMHKLGLFVLAREAAYYCRATDAFVGTYNIACSGFPTKDGAEREMARLYARNAALADDGEYVLVILAPAGR